MTLGNLQNHSVSIAAEYQISGIPFFQNGTAAAAPNGPRIDFDHTTQRVRVEASGSLLRVSATEFGMTGSRYFELDDGGVLEMPWRVNRIYLQGGGFQVVASLTTVRSDTPTAVVLNELSASNGWDGLG